MVSLSFNFFTCFITLSIIKYCYSQDSWNIDPEGGQKSQEQVGNPGFDVTRFGCDPDEIPINSVRQEEMTDDNYLR